MLLFLCGYAIFYAPIMPLYAHIYAPNYADYAQIMQIMLKLCLIMPIMPKYAVYAKLCNYAKLCPSARARRGRSKWSSLKPPGCTSSLAQYLEAKKNAHTHTHTHRNALKDRVAAGDVVKKPRQRKRLRGRESSRGGRDLLDGTGAASAIQRLRGGLSSRSVWVGMGDGLPWAGGEVVLAYASGGGQFRWQLCEIRFVRISHSCPKGEVRKARWTESGASLSSSDRQRLSEDKMWTLRCAERSELAALAQTKAATQAEEA